VTVDKPTRSPGERIVITTKDGHRFGGRLIELRKDSLGRELAVVRLDSGWVTSYPLEMVRGDST
jgi:hypothetical protein